MMGTTPRETLEYSRKKNGPMVEKGSMKVKMSSYGHDRSIWTFHISHSEDLSETIHYKLGQWHFLGGILRWVCNFRIRHLN